jgi:hypothetical protein
VELNLTAVKRDLWVSSAEIVPPEAVNLIRRAAWLRFWKALDHFHGSLGRRSENEQLADQEAVEQLQKDLESLFVPLGLVAQLARIYDEEGRLR